MVSKLDGFQPVLTFGGVQVSKSEFDILQSIFNDGICLLCGRSGLTNRYGSKLKHWRACRNKYTLLEKEKLYVEAIAYNG
jgi:hypothetical protein